MTINIKSGWWSHSWKSSPLAKKKLELLLPLIILWNFYCSVAKSCPTLCDPMDCSAQGVPVLHYLLEFAQTQVHWVDDVIQPSHPLCSSSPPALNLSQHQGPFPMSWLFTSGGQSIGASASVLPMNIQDWFPLGLTGLISLVSKGLSRVFFSTTVQKHQFFNT